MSERNIEADLKLCEAATPGPVKWQKFGKQYYLTGQYGMRPIIFATITAEIEGVFKDIHISNRDAERDLLIPLNPNHPDSKFVEEAWDALPYYIGEVKRLEAQLKAAEAVVEAAEVDKNTCVCTGDYSTCSHYCDMITTCKALTDYKEAYPNG